MEDQSKTNDSNDSNQSNQPNEKKRAVTISAFAKVIFESKSTGSSDSTFVNRDIFSVTDVIGQKLSSTNSKEEMEDILVSVHSVEDPDKSDPLPEGESPWEGEYLVANMSIEKLSIPDAMTALAQAILPPDQCLKGVERLAEQLFLRSRMDGFVLVCTFDNVPSVIPLISSFKDIKPEFLATLYQQLHLQAERLRSWVGSKFPNITVNWEPEDLNSEPTTKANSTHKNPAIKERSGLVLPSGAPIETLSKNKTIIS